MSLVTAPTSGNSKGWHVSKGRSALWSLPPTRIKPSWSRNGQSRLMWLSRTTRLAPSSDCSCSCSSPSSLLKASRCAKRSQNSSACCSSSTWSSRALSRESASVALAPLPSVLVFAFLMNLKIQAVTLFSRDQLENDSGFSRQFFTN